MFADAGLFFPYSQDMGSTNHQFLLHEEGLPCHLSANGSFQDGTSSFRHQSGHTMDLTTTVNISEYHLDEEEILFHAPQFEHEAMTAPISMISFTDESASIEATKVDENSNILEYLLGGEVDLFKGPEPILEEPELELDSPAAAIPMIPASSDFTEEEATALPDITSIESNQLLDEYFPDHKGDLSENAVMEPSRLDVKTQSPLMEGDLVTPKDGTIPEAPIAKSVSMECLVSEDWGMPGPGGTIRPTFLDFHGMNFGAAFGMRRAYSDGDIKTLSSANLSLVNNINQEQRLLVMGSHRIEERQEKLSRYRRKKSMRNFGRKIKYACRKALADSQPRVRGRFARTEGCDVPRIPKWRMRCS